MRRVFSLLLLVAGLLSDPLASARSPRAELQLGLFNRFNAHVNRPETLLRFNPQSRSFDSAGYLGPREAELGYSFVVHMRTHFKIARVLELTVDIDSGEVEPAGRRPVTWQLPVSGESGLVPLAGTDWEEAGLSDGQDFLEVAQQTFFLRDLYFRMKMRDEEFRVDIGRRTLQLGGGLIYDDSSIGLSMEWDFWEMDRVPITMELGVALPTRNMLRGLESPLTHFELRGFFGGTASFSILFAYLHDSEGLFDRHLVPWFSELAATTPGNQQGYAWALAHRPDTRSDIFWTGAHATVETEIFSANLHMLIQTGTIRMRDPSLRLAELGVQVPAPEGLRLDLPSFGIGGLLDMRVKVEDEWTLAAFVLGLTGSDNPFTREVEYENAEGGFTGLTPHLVSTNLFFRGGLNETFTRRGGPQAGVNNRGVFAGGLQIEWDSEWMYLEQTTAVLFSHRPSIYGGTFYGVEIDLEGYVPITDWLGFAFEYDVLIPGDFFASPEAIHQVRLGLDFTYQDEERL